MEKSRTTITLIAAVALIVLAVWSPARAQNVVLYDNGPLVTHADSCTDQDASRVQVNLGMSTIGFGHQFINGNRMADDFTVPSGGWNIDSITFYAYQTGAPSSPSPITGLYVQIWDGSPDDNESSVIWGDLTTNILYDSYFTNIQRDTETTPCANNRYIFADTALIGEYFAPGTYWLDWMTDGSLTSGPWAPPVTLLGQTTTGNALQYTTSSGVWAPAYDTGPYTQQDMPFIIMGPQCETDNECDDGLFCTGVETCDNGTCVASSDPCGDDTPLCDEDNNVCVECLSDDNCTEGQICDEGVCIFPCELFIKYKEIRAEKLTKDRKWVFFITGDEDFDLFGLIDFDPFTWHKVKFNRKKNRLKIIATVPAGLAPGVYPVSIGECSGEIVVTGNES
jgi:Cys-rich repeat protein